MTRDYAGVARGGGGSSSSRFVLADQVFELSSKLGKLRQRSSANADALRAATQVTNTSAPRKMPLPLVLFTELGCVVRIAAKNHAVGWLSTRYFNPKPRRKYLFRDWCFFRDWHSWCCGVPVSNRAPKIDSGLVVSYVTYGRCSLCKLCN